MTQNVFWIFELTIKEGQIDNLKKIMLEMVEATKANESGTMAYEWTISEDNKKCHIHERYEDSEATLTHLATFLSQYAARLMETGDATGFVVYGNPNDEVKKILDGFNAVYMVPIGGFIR
ncbi:MAG: antibiotic biosynthesis monooxygenase [Eubacteriaceae bacterium]|nr:antibiotic biosynthesis monooxygenase [Eubacteriaceae bacterium]